jgi:hypothetical protein
MIIDHLVKNRQILALNIEDDLLSFSVPSVPGIAH